MSKRILRLPVVMEMTGLSRSSIYQRMKEGTFPASVKLGTRAVGWPSDVIDRWLDDVMQRGAA